MSPRTTIDLQPGALLRTRYEAEQALADAGVTGAAADAVLRSTGKARHIHRIRMHEEHALAQALLDEGLEGLDPAEAPPSILALAVAILVLDAFGPVPRHGETSPKVRHRAFRSDGKLEGPTASAVQASAYGALILLSRRFGVATPQITLSPEDGDLRVEVSGGTARSADCLVRVWPSERYDCQPCGWTLHAAQEGLNRSVGIGATLRIWTERSEDDHHHGRSPLDVVHAFEGSPAAWSEVWKKAIFQQRLETTLDRWNRVVGELAPEDAQAAPPVVGSSPKRPSLDQALAWIGELELNVTHRERLAESLVLGEMVPAALEEQLRWALGHRLGRTG